MRGASPAPTSGAAGPRLRRLVWLAAALALGAWCYGPALHAWFAQDDYALLALVRLLRQPWLVFVHEHFPGAPYFRPLGVFAWWLVAAAADGAAWPQYALNLALHLGCVGALYVLLQRLRRDAALNALWAALYAAHPLALGTALWLADRFDLLATLFSLLALLAAVAYAERPRAAVLCGLLGALLLALASKELGIVATAAAFAAIALAPRTRLDARRRTIALAAIAALAGGWLAYRHAMLTSFGDGAANLPAPAALAAGFRNWLRAGAAFLFADPRMPRWGTAVLTLAAALWLTARLAAFTRRQTDAVPRRHVAAGLIVLILLPGVVQAPVAYKHLAGAIGSDMFFFHLIVPSRFFHLSLAGLLGGLALLTPPARAGALRLPATAIVLALATLAPLSHRIAQDYADGTRRDIAALDAAEAALDKAAIPARACQIYFLHTSALWGFDGYSDSMIKGLAPQPERLAHCLIGSERTPYVYFVRRGSVQPSDYRPLQPLVFAGKPFPVLEIGDTQARFFTIGGDFAAALPDSAIFLEYRDGAFVDVSSAVRSGEHKVPFATPNPN